MSNIKDWKDTHTVVIKNRIPAILENRGMSTYSLAKRIGRRHHVVARIAKGERGVSDQLKKEISDGLELPVEEVFYFSEK